MFSKISPWDVVLKVDLQRSRALLKIVFSGDQALTGGSPILFPSLKTPRWTYPVQVHLPGPFII